MKGKLIAVEGIDGSGKTTLVRDLVRHLRKRGIDAIATKEPWSARWRDAVCRGNVMASTADRAAHMHEVVWPALERGIHVVTDRYYMSCAAYENGRSARRMVATLVGQRALFGAPDLWIYLAQLPGQCYARVVERGGVEAHEADLSRLVALHDRYNYLYGCVQGAKMQIDAPQETALAVALDRVRNVIDKGEAI